jgi:dipeptide transport system substrate-binding protein
VSPDGKSYVFHLRHGVKFQSNAHFTPSRDFDADDVLFSIERQWKADNPFHGVSGGSYDYFGDMDMARLLKTVEKLDDYTIRIELTEPQAPFLADLAMDFASILSAEYAQTLLAAGTPELIDHEPIGTGPFAFVQYQTDALIRYKRFAGYWGPAPKVEWLVFLITPDASVRFSKLKAGECHIASFPALADLPAIRQDARLTLMEQPGLNIGYLAFNVLKKPFDDKRVRVALAMAVDKQAILAAVYQGAGQPAKNLIPPTIWSYHDAIVDYPYDPVAAKQLLAEAGYPDGFATDLWAMPVSRPYNPDGKRMAEMIQSDLGKVGVTAKIVTYEWGEYRKRVQQGEDQLAEFGWTGDNGDPDNFFATIADCAAARPGGGNLAKWCNHDFDALVLKAATLPDQAARAKLYEQAQVIMHDQEPFLLIAHSIVYMPMMKKVHGYVMDPLGKHKFDQVEIE